MIRTFTVLGALALCSGCTAQEAANFVSGAQTFCQDAETGIAIVAPPASANTTKLATACGKISALPPGSFAPVTAPAAPAAMPPAQSVTPQPAPLMTPPAA